MSKEPKNADEDVERVESQMPEQDDSNRTEPTDLADDQPSEQGNAADNDSVSSDEPEATHHSTGQSRVKRLVRAYLSKKKLTIPLTIFGLLAVLAAVPVSRYAVAGLFLQKQFYVVVVDSVTNKPISEVDVEMGGQSLRTNAEGKAEFKSKVGNKNVTVSKKYYKDLQDKVTIPIGGNAVGVLYKLTATGRQISVNVKDTISSKPIEGAVITVADTKAKSDNKGLATVVVPANGGPFDASVVKQGFNDTKLKLTAKDDAIATAEAKLTAVGKIYFLSKLSGKIDVVKTNLDGTERQTVVTGTGREEEGGTSLLASRDWKYLALQARREGDKQKLYLIDTSNDKMTTLDEGNATFTSSGWAGHNFVYLVTRDSQKYYEPKREAIKSFNADSKLITILDETRATGGESDYKYEYISDGVKLLEDEAIWSKRWSHYYQTDIAGLETTLNSTTPDGKNKKIVKSGPASAYLSSILYEPRELVVSWSDSSAQTFYTYENGKLSEDKSINNDVFNRPYPTYLLSPDGKQTFWSESRDGKNFLFIGGVDAESPKTVATLPDYSVYGWYTDDYLLVSKKGSELFILPASGVAEEKNLVKVSDYHKPDYNYRGYGGGYGGL